MDEQLFVVLAAIKLTTHFSCLSDCVIFHVYSYNIMVFKVLPVGRACVCVNTCCELESHLKQLTFSMHAIDSIAVFRCTSSPSSMTEVTCGGRVQLSHCGL